MPKWKVFTPPDFLPFFGKPEGFDGEDLLPPQLCALVMRALESGELSQASWVIQATELTDSIDRIEQVAEEFEKLSGEADKQEADALALAGM